VKTPVQLAIVDKIEQVLISKRGGEFQPNGEIRFLCPEHDDHNPSADWSPDKQVWTCRACGAGGGYVDISKSLEISMPSTNGDGVSESWDVRDNSGALVATKHRGIRDGEKTYWWDPKPPPGPGTRGLPLFGTERIKDFDPEQPVIITEGEKAAQYLINIGVQALGTSTGANGTPDRQVFAALERFDIYLWADNDESGRDHMERIGTLIPGARFIDWPDAPDKGDAADFVNQDGNKESLEQLIVASSDTVPGTSPSGVKVPGIVKADKEFLGGVMSAEDVLNYKAPEVTWLWEGRIGVGGLMLVASRPKVGKTQLLCGLALAVSRGAPFLNWQTKQTPVLYLAFEGHRRDLYARFIQMGLSKDDQIFIRVLPPPIFDAGQNIFDNLIYPLVEELKPGLVIIDTLFRMSPEIADGNDYAGMNRVLAPIENVARTTEVTFALSHHANKSRTSDDPSTGILGSTAILGGVDSALILQSRRGNESSVPGRELMSYQREGLDLEPIVVDLDEYGIPTNGGRAEDFAVESVKEQIREVLSNEDEMQATKLTDSLNGQRAIRQKALRSLVDSGEVVFRKEGRKKFYSLREVMTR